MLVGVLLSANVFMSLSVCLLHQRGAACAADSHIDAQVWRVAMDAVQQPWRQFALSPVARASSRLDFAKGEAMVVADVALCCTCACDALPRPLAVSAHSCSKVKHSALGSPNELFLVWRLRGGDTRDSSPHSPESIFLRRACGSWATQQV